MVLGLGLPDFLGGALAGGWGVGFCAGARAHAPDTFPLAAMRRAGAQKHEESLSLHFSHV